ncbi:nuclear transport factor 2 family protein [Pedobacter yulinensis]|uniref:Nuclear transport factor 2 family protein n=1 Tax=Pedobacter yulinensis TaxID=2126353 RepID=A0A2T3HLH3_9SPHI|nr:nuclear transport factor 2 family protein [Pedobacter yulinensis]PST83295.1 nuclear transport factor 2 family protein [Pedobacter yulinensis]
MMNLQTKFAWLICSTLAVTACSDRPMNTGGTIRAVADSLFFYFNAHNWKAYAAMYADTAQFLDPALGQRFVWQSRAETEAKYAAMQESVPDVRDSIRSMHVDGETVVVEFTAKGTEAGKPFELPICTVLKIREGRIVRDATYYDQP